MIKQFLTLVIKDTKTVFSSFRNEGAMKTFSLLNSREAPGIVQFAKYGVCGVISVIVMLVGTELASIFLKLPFEKGMEGIDPHTSERNFMICSWIAFPLANVAAYILNVLWVFTPGRHSRLKEFAMFTGVALFAFVVGLLGGPILISKGLNPRIAQAGLVVTSALVNYVCRKVLIFLK